MEPNQELEELAAGDTSADVAYRWTVRVLYATAIALNVWVLWTMADETETAVIRAKVLQLRDRIMRPIHERRRFQKHANEVVFEAMQIVDATATEGPAADG